MEQILLDRKSVTACKPSTILENVSISNALLLDVILVSSVKTILIGVSKSLHYKDTVAHIN